MLLVLVVLSSAIALMPLWIPTVARGWNALGDRITTPAHRAWQRCTTSTAAATCGPEPPPFIWSRR